MCTDPPPPTLFQDYVPACSYEGENVVMCQQTARFLVKAARAQAQGNGSQGVPYLEKAYGDGPHSARGWTDSPAPALDALAGRAKHLVVAGAGRLEREVQCVPRRPGPQLRQHAPAAHSWPRTAAAAAVPVREGVSPLQAWDRARSLLVAGAVAHTEWVAAKMFADGAEGAAPVR